MKMHLSYSSAPCCQHPQPEENDMNDPIDDIEQ